MKTTSLLSLMLMALSSNCASNEAIHVEVVDKSDRVEVLVRNQGDHVLHINRRFAVGLIDRGADIEFVIHALHADEQTRMTATVEPWPLEDADKVMLRPDEIIGVAIKKCFLAQLHSLAPGEYSIQVRYAPDIAWEPFVKTAVTKSKETRVSFDVDAVESKSCFGM